MPKPKPNEPIAPEVLEAAIVQVAADARKLFASRLADKTVILLISHASGISQRDVKAVLHHAMMLETTYLKPRKK